ncbi:oligopeptide ABC transporter substrate-binding protein [Cytobacillus sp. OWB-43]|uniref:oligopeptide ABC transporter substrate-binding protein n=1 Tax=Cytobacillus sp. OWB-43 TaxID=3108468 RepID=UPI002AFF4861|nr:oligopeptide ABC transporter substrate-binding protein [Cytobacillus sp. OWB-43]MEA1851655.1 oligopeptide ABC transporter substrate-binding protein [Cytobacillus sp. OWB-43]
MKKKSFWLISLLLVFSMFLAACNSGNETSGNEKDGDKDEANTGEPVEGGNVTVAVTSAPEGVLEPAYYGSAIDAEILNFMTDGIYSVNDELEYEPDLATWEISDDKLTYTFKFKEGVKWHNGEELTAEDYQFALETMADPEYTGPRFNYVEGIKGAKEKKDGKAETIEGIELVDKYTIAITFESVKINNLENLWSYPMPKKHYEGVAIAELGESEQVRQTPVGLGAFKVKSVKAGEYVELEKFADYYKGEPKLDGVVVKVIDPAVANGALQNGEVDIMGVAPAQVEELETMEHITVEETNGVGYSYIGLRFGHRDQETRTNVDDFDKFKSKELRHALIHALDRQAMIDAFLSGKGTVSNTVIPSTFWIAAEESELNQYEYDPEKAKELLAEAGYKDVDGDGFVEDPEGEPFSISFGHYAGNATFEGRSQAIIQSWNDIGVKTELATGSLVEFNLYNDMKDKDDEALEAFFGSWSTGSDPDPSGLWANNAEWNYGRWVNEDNQRLLDEGLSEKAFDKEYRKEVYVEWQKLFNDELPGIPLWENLDLYGINKRLQGVHINAVGYQTNTHEWYVTE